MKLIGIYVAVTFCIFLLPACKKNDKDLSPAGKALVAGRWQITASTSTFSYNGKDTTVDYYSGWRACEQDDFMEFGDDGHCTSNENANKCPEDDQVVNFNWELQNNDSRLQLTLNKGVFTSTGSATATFEILELTDSQLKLTMLSSVSSAPPTTETYKNIR